MTRDEILDAYEGLWRQAALMGRAQGTAPVGESHKIEGGPCAWLLPDWQRRPLGEGLRCGAEDILLAWTCLCCGERNHRLSTVMIHLNDAHRWDWLDFANKFRDALAQGERLAGSMNAPASEPFDGEAAE